MNREQLIKLIDDRTCSNCAERLANEIMPVFARKDELLRETMDFMLHDSECINAKWSAGRPTDDGGYEMKYGEKWYQTRPVDKTPKCECGVDNLITRIRKELGE